MSLANILTLFCLSVLAVSNFRLETDTDDEEGSDANQSIVIFMAMGAGRRSGGFSGGYSGGGYRYRSPAPAPVPKSWVSLPINCEKRFNTGYCELMLLHTALVARHGEQAGITPADACQKIWPGDFKKQPRHMYCLAAAADPKISELAQNFKHRVPDDPAKCSVEHLSHFKNGRSFFDATPEERLRHADSYYMFGNEISSDLEFDIRKACKSLLSTEPDGFNDGFCRTDAREGQDCVFLWGIRGSWKNNYGNEYCEALPQLPGQLRCLALRKQIIRIAQSQSLFNIARWSKFDDVIRISRKSCPQPPADAPAEPSKEEVIDEAERTDEE